MKNKEYSPQFSEFISTLKPEETICVQSFIAGLNRHLSLPYIKRVRMLYDFENALIYLYSTGLSVEKCVSRLDPEKLGSFYENPSTDWYSLDFSAKIYPLSMKRSQMAVFRLSAYLTEAVVPELLQIAVTFTMKRFPFFAVAVRKGFFWHHIDTINTRFEIKPDNGCPCSPIGISQSGSPALRILYFENRISVEFFHILTDGNGGMVFLKTLTAEYLRLTGKYIPFSDGVLNIEDFPNKKEYSNDFEKFYKPGKSAGFIDTPAAQMSGSLTHNRPCQIIHFDMDSGSLLSAAHKKSVSVTALLTSVIFIATRSAMNSHEGNIHVQIPVNMRKFHSSETLRNFAMYCSIRLPVKDVINVDDILPSVSRQLRENASEDEMNKMLCATVKLVNSLKFVPLFIKKPVAGAVYGFLGDKVFTNTLSNLGIVKIPEEMSKYVEKFDFVLGTVVTNRTACSLVTLGEHAVLSIEKLTTDPSFEEKLYSELSNLGIKFDVSGSEYYGD